MRSHSQQQELQQERGLQQERELQQEQAQEPLPLPRRAQGQVRAPPLGRMTRPRGSTASTLQQRTSIDASSVLHLSRKNESIDQQARGGQSSRQQIDREGERLTLIEVGKGGTYLRFGFRLLPLCSRFRTLTMRASSARSAIVDLRQPAPRLDRITSLPTRRAAIREKPTRDALATRAVDDKSRAAPCAWSSLPTLSKAA